MQYKLLEKNFLALTLPSLHIKLKCWALVNILRFGSHGSQIAHIEIYEKNDLPKI